MSITQSVSVTGANSSTGEVEISVSIAQPEVAATLEAQAIESTLSATGIKVSAEYSAQCNLFD
jgi:hypothetical protein